MAGGAPGPPAFLRLPPDAAFLVLASAGVVSICSTVEPPCSDVPPPCRRSTQAAHGDRGPALLRFAQYWGCNGTRTLDPRRASWEHRGQVGWTVIGRQQSPLSLRHQAVAALQEKPHTRAPRLPH